MNKENIDFTGIWESANFRRYKQTKLVKILLICINYYIAVDHLIKELKFVCLMSNLLT